MVTKIIVIGVLVLLAVFLFVGAHAAYALKKQEGEPSVDAPQEPEYQDIRKYDLKTSFIYEEVEDGKKVEYPIYIHTIRCGKDKGAKVACIFKVSKTKGLLYRAPLNDGQSIANQILTTGQLK